MASKMQSSDCQPPQNEPAGGSQNWNKSDAAQKNWLPRSTRKRKCMIEKDQAALHLAPRQNKGLKDKSKRERCGNC